MLLRDGADGRYLSSVAENSMFSQNTKNMVTSMSDNLLCARYDDRSVNLLKEDLQQAWAKTSLSASKN